MESYNNANMASSSECYTEDAIIFPPNSGMIKARVVIKSFWEGNIDVGEEQ